MTIGAAILEATNILLCCSEEFDITAGVLQGDTLAPFLFIIFLDYAIRQAITGREESLGFTIKPRRSSRPAATQL